MHRSADTHAAAVEAHNLQVSYGSFRAVRGVNLAVRPGELYALLGTNGAGKTSTLEVLEGLRAPWDGTVRVFGHDPRLRQRVRPRVGTMLQESGFAPDLTVAETVALTGRISGRRDHPARVLEQAGLTGKAGARVVQLSGGERRLLDFACALFGSPDLLFLDEPTTGLDLTARDRVWDGVGKLRRAGCTVVLTTHYLEEAQQYADRVALMHRGVVRYEGTVPDVAASFPARIAFRAPRPAPHATAPAPATDTDWQAVLLQPRGGGAGLKAAVVTVEGTEVVIRTAYLQRDLAALLGWAADYGMELAGLTARPACLDDIFRDLAAGSVAGVAA